MLPTQLLFCSRIFSIYNLFVPIQETRRQRQAEAAVKRQKEVSVFSPTKDNRLHVVYTTLPLPCIGRMRDVAYSILRQSRPNKRGEKRLRNELSLRAGLLTLLYG